ncbi:MAG: dynamin family protein [Gammaproteobacteria bacterium]|nr:dynamin family protein [Gammaproteobacteria bacterium]
MVRPDKSIVKRFDSLKAHLKQENPLLLDVMGGYKDLDRVAYRMGLLPTSDSYAMQIAWWPLVSILGTFSAGKSSFINTYLGGLLQKTGNQAVDDKFTVISFGKDKAGQVLPGIALDADMRFPFYRISTEIEKVVEGEGKRIDAYLQLKVSDADVLRGKILIDSPGFDADEQRSSILKITDHIMDISDLVLVFFDARHPEPGAMQDTLSHLVTNSQSRADSTKFLYILNQIDTAAREDNTEEVVSAWQRALSQTGLTTGRYYTIYNAEVAPQIEDEALRERYESKANEDLTEIYSRIDQVEVERSYRIVGALENQATSIRDKAVPVLTGLNQRFKSHVLRLDGIVLIALLLIVLGVGVATKTIGALAALLLSLFADPISMFGAIVVGLIVIGGVHFTVRHLVRQRMLKGLTESDESQYTESFKLNTAFYRSIFATEPVGWSARTEKKIEAVIERSTTFVQSLNDQFTNPSGENK